MSLISKMKMRATISRNVEPETEEDSHKGYDLDWTTVVIGAKCFIILHGLTDTNYKQVIGGQTDAKFYDGFFQPNENIKVGDKVECDKFPNEFFLVESANSIVHPIKNIVHHIECKLTVM